MQFGGMHCLNLQGQNVGEFLPDYTESYLIPLWPHCHDNNKSNKINMTFTCAFQETVYNAKHLLRKSESIISWNCSLCHWTAAP
jgi:hypothetical protein